MIEIVRRDISNVTCPLGSRLYIEVTQAIARLRQAWPVFIGQIVIERVVRMAHHCSFAEYFSRLLDPVDYHVLKHNGFAHGHSGGPASRACSDLQGTGTSRRKRAIR
jgi:hypothetical protein